MIYFSVKVSYFLLMHAYFSCVCFSCSFPSQMIDGLKHLSCDLYLFLKLELRQSPTVKISS